MLGAELNTSGYLQRLQGEIDRLDQVPQSFTELSGFLVDLQQQPGFDRDTPVVIVAGNEVRWDHVVSCWNAALRAECTKIAFADP